MIVNAEERGCNARHNLVDVMENLPKKHNFFRTLGTMELNISTCMGCHRGYQELWGNNLILDDAMHSLHYSNPNFTGNCLSCHDIDNDGNYVMWDYNKYTKFMGVSKVSNIQGNSVMTRM